jgi:Arc/MetJ-type ribon-helix-helix transcriptional regulator
MELRQVSVGQLALRLKSLAYDNMKLEFGRDTYGSTETNTRCRVLLGPCRVRDEPISVSGPSFCDSLIYTPRIILPIRTRWRWARLRRKPRAAIVLPHCNTRTPRAVTITIRLPGKLETALRARLDAGRVALSDFVRDAIAEKLAREPAEKASAYELGKHLFGKHGSGRHDLSSSRKAILNDILRAKHRR